MSKKNALTPTEVHKTITDYLQALKLARSEAVMDQTELTYRSGCFWLRPDWYKSDAPPIPYRLKEIQAMTADLQKQIPPRPDQEEDSFQ